MGHAYWSSSSSLPNMIKLSQTVRELWSAQGFGFRGYNYIMKIELSLLHVTCLLVLLYIPTKYYQNMSKGIQVMELTRMCLLTDGRTPCWSLYPPDWLSKPFTLCKNSADWHFEIFFLIFSKKIWFDTLCKLSQYPCSPFMLAMMNKFELTF